VTRDGSATERSFASLATIRYPKPMAICNSLQSLPDLHNTDTERVRQRRTFIAMIASMQSGNAPRSNKLLIIFAFACVYLCWGSAFVAIRYSVQTIHPAFVAGARYVVASLLLLGYLLARGESLRISTRDLRQVTLLRLLMFSCDILLLDYGGRELPAALTAPSSPSFSFSSLCWKPYCRMALLQQ